jgi:Cys-tRNA(Pro)/Cys-tRNA(Cys) deacylase
VSLERGSVSVLAAAIAGLLALLSTAVVAGGVVSAGRGRAVAAADAAALAAAPVTFRPFGASGSPADEAQRLAAEHGATLLRCDCPIDPSWSPRVVEVEVAVTVEMFGSHTVRAVSRAEFDPVRLLALPLSSPAVAASVTAATRTLDRAAVSYRIHPYTVEGEAPTYGEMVASSLGVEPGRVFKTLVAMVDGSPVVAIVPVDGQLDLKALAHAAGGKRAAMAEPGVAERLTGYVVGGISPFGQRRRLPTFLDRSALRHDTVFVSGGRRGLQLEVSPLSLTRMTGASAAPIAAGHGR